jgi:hypothetical protein
LPLLLENEGIWRLADKLFRSGREKKKASQNICEALILKRCPGTESDNVCYSVHAYAGYFEKKQKYLLTCTESMYSIILLEHLISRFYFNEKYEEGDD